MDDPSTGQPRATSGGSVAGRALKGLLLGLLPLLVLLLLSELLLWALGLGDPRERLSLTRGFDERARYLVADPAVPGGWVTQMFEGATPELHIPPKGSRLRLVMFGGSNTQGFPEQYLDDVLNMAVKDPGYEIINLGRQGYGSERVRILLEQAMVLKPDIVFLYVGHNEFVERGFAMELAEQWDQPWLVQLANRLMHLRTLNVIVEALERKPPPDATSGPPPEKRTPRSADFRDLTYDKTLLFYDEYKRNVESMVATAEAHGAQVLLSTVVGNMLVPPIVMNDPPNLDGGHALKLHKLQADAVKLVPERLRAGLLQTGKSDPPVRLDPRDWGETVMSAEREQHSEGLLAKRAEELADVPFTVPALRSIAAPFAGGPFWTDSSKWNGAVRALLPTVSAVSLRELSDAERAQLGQAESLLKQALVISPHDANTLYDLGLVTWLLGADDARATQLLRDSARYDHAPTRGTDVDNGMVRDVAAAHPEVLFVDAEELVRAACPGGLIGYEVLMDNCHLYSRARPLLMDQFMPGFLELGKRCAKH